MPGISANFGKKVTFFTIEKLGFEVSKNKTFRISVIF
jgi:hypothetical protein